ncbi:HEPN domain-containing protein [Burkholderia gladioli]|uniref:HEPN domain-containing protein n=1 Tax=Burkholderia gladioli TaxID=28095 RepID=UPI0016401554|nr:HEPN domain-containing protein [Burkholderia gladioli]MDC6129325.1 HEPN domain-containing protein [Burkholderia gladioli]
MAATSRWVDLETEIEKIRRVFLPAAFDPSGTYPDQLLVHTHTRAFLLLSHAEIEHFLEVSAKAIARTAEDSWKLHGKFYKPTAFIAAAHSVRVPVNEKVAGTSKGDFGQVFSQSLLAAFAEFYKVIKENNGIKEHNFAKMFTPIGLSISDLSGTLLTRLDALGEKRGAEAHNSGKSVPVLLDPETEYKSVKELVADLELLDSFLEAYRGGLV